MCHKNLYCIMLDEKDNTCISSLPCTSGILPVDNSMLRPYLDRFTYHLIMQEDYDKLVVSDKWINWKILK